MRHILLASTFLLSVGCVGGITGWDDDDDGPPPSLARQMFEADVYPVLTASCGAGCHLAGASTSTAFVGVALDTAYLTVTGYNSVVGNFTETGAPILTKIDPGPHNSRAYTPDQRAKVVGWLAQEVLERAGPVNPNDPPPTETPGEATARLIGEWSGCLQEIDFVELRFGEVWANKTSNGGNCEQCHSNGAEGFLANDDNVFTYQVLSTNKFFMLMYFKANVIDLANAKIEPNPDPFYRVGRNEAPFTEHPSFNIDNPTPGIGVSPIVRLQELYDRTMARKLAGPLPPPAGCGPPTLTN